MALARRLAVLLAIAATGLTGGHALAQSTGSAAGAPQVPAPQGDPGTGVADPAAADVGACCIADGHCYVCEELSCNAAGGTWTNGVTCLTAGCEFVGACCIPGSGSQCVDFRLSQCEDVGGLFLGDGTTCASSSCDTPLGACCYSDLACVLSTPADCSLTGGRYQGDGVPCTLDVPCPVIGACCMSDGTCLENRSATECRNAGGEWSQYMGFATACDQVECTGACITVEPQTCLPACVADLTADDCAATGGAYQGHGSDCSAPAFTIVQTRTVTAFQTIGTPTEDDVLFAYYPVGDNALRPLVAVTVLADGQIVSKLVAEVSSKLTQGVDVIVPLEEERDFVAIAPLPLLPPDALKIFNYDGPSVPPADQIRVPGGGVYLLPGEKYLVPAVVLEPETTHDFGGPLNYPVPGADVSNFVGVGDFDATLSAQGAWTQDFSGFGVLNPVHRFVGTITVIYEFSVNGACCYCDGGVTVCSIETEEDCAALNGDFYCDTPCAEVDCPIRGACCFPCQTPECVDRYTAAECEAEGGLWQGECTTCDTVVCPVLGACCLCDGTCTDDLTSVECAALAAATGAPDCYTWTPCTTCTAVVCEPRGVCCLTDGTTQECVTRQWCIDNGGPCWAWWVCATTPPEPCEPKGACCYCDGGQTVCADCVTQVECEALECGVWHAGLSCADVVCEPRGHCKLCTGEILPAAGGACLTVDECAALAAGTAQPDCYVWLECDVPEPGALGACCDPCSEACLPCVTQAHCEATNWTWLGDCSSCDDCPTPQYCPDGCRDRGSLIIIEKVELVWDSKGQLMQDTFIHLTNDYPADVRVQMFFVNGDEPLPASDGERAHPGCNFIDNAIFLTANQPVYWAASTGMPVGLSPWEILDPAPPGELPGRPSPEGNGERVLRGYIVLWAVDLLGREIHWNHLFATAKLIRYDVGMSAWEYQACAFEAIKNVPNGGLLNLPYGRLDLDGQTEYSQPNAQLLMNFPASGSTIFSQGASGFVNDSDLTLLPPDGVYLLNGGQPPVPMITQTDISVWNEAEVKFGGPRRCIVCWDQTLLSQYGIPNSFLLTSLQSNVGKARIDGVQSDLCPDSQARALIGVQAVRMYGPAGGLAGTAGLPTSGPRLEAGYNLFGIGGESATIWSDAHEEEPPGESPASGGRAVSDPFTDAMEFLNDLFKAAQDRASDRP